MVDELVRDKDIAHDQALLRDPVLSLFLPHLPPDGRKQVFIEEVCKLPDDLAARVCSHLSSFRVAAPEARPQTFRPIYDLLRDPVVVMAYPERADDRIKLIADLL